MLPNPHVRSRSLVRSAAVALRLLALNLGRMSNLFFLSEFRTLTFYFSCSFDYISLLPFLRRSVIAFLPIDDFQSDLGHLISPPLGSPPWTGTSFHLLSSVPPPAFVGRFVSFRGVHGLRDVDCFFWFSVYLVAFPAVPRIFDFVGDGLSEPPPIN